MNESNSLDLRSLKTLENYADIEANYLELISALKIKKPTCFIQPNSMKKMVGTLNYIDMLYFHHIIDLSILAAIMVYDRDYNKIVNENYNIIKYKWIQLDIEGKPSLYDILTTWTPKQIKEKILLNDSIKNQPVYTEDDLYG
jgi:hypothetical protein